MTQNAYLLAALKEDNNLLIEMIANERPEKAKLVVLLAHRIGLHEIFWRTLRGMLVHRYVRWIMQAEAGQIFHRFGLRGREQHGLTSALGQVVHYGVHGLGKAEI